jgi:hypothetical protein
LCNFQVGCLEGFGAEDVAACRSVPPTQTMIELQQKVRKITPTFKKDYGELFVVTGFFTLFEKLDLQILRKVTLTTTPSC